MPTDKLYSPICQEVFFLMPVIKAHGQAILVKPGYMARRSDLGIVSDYHFKCDYYHLIICILHCITFCVKIVNVFIKFCIPLLLANY